MGDRFGPNRGGGQGGSDGYRGAGNHPQFRPHLQGGHDGGRGVGYNSQYGPPQRQNQGNFLNFQNNQFRGQNFNQFRGQGLYNPNQSQINQGNQNYQHRGQNNQRSQFAGSNNPSGVQNKQGTYVPKGTSSGGESVATQKEKAVVPAAEGGVSKLQCFRCYNHGDHITKDCTADVLCVNCDKISHISGKCAWLHQKISVASFVGFGGEGLGCFVAEHTKEVATGSKGNDVAIIRIKDDSVEEVSSEKLELGLGSTYPWKWTWEAKKVADGIFLVEFPSVARINEAALYDWVPLKHAKIMVNIKLWTDESLAAGKLTTVWVRAKGVPKILKNFHGLCEVGSTLGQHLEADMEHLKKTGQVRLKVGVVNHLKIPKWTRLVTPKLHYYRIYFQLEEIVEMGWDRDEEDFLQTFDEMMDSQPEENEDRVPKRQKNSDPAASSPSGLLFPSDKNIVASTRTLIALEQRELELRQQDEVDVRINLEKGGRKSLFTQVEKEIITNNLQENQGENGLGNETTEKKEEERVQLSDEDMEEDFENSQADSFSDKVKALTGNAVGQNNSQKANETRFSSRLADKNPEDVSILEKAKTHKAKISEKDEGIGGRKTGNANGRKAAGTSRGCSLQGRSRLGIMEGAAGRMIAFVLWLGVASLLD